MPVVQGPRRLISWKEIADYLGRDVRTVVRWEKDKALPVHRVPGGKRQAVYAFSDELDRWLRGESGVAAASSDSSIPLRASDVPTPIAPERRIRRAEWALLIAVALISFSLLGFLFRPQIQASEPLRLVKLNTEAGIIAGAMLSPDGRQVAYSFRRNGEPVAHAYVQLIGAGDPVRVTKSDEQEWHTTWSPDGRYLAFLAISGDSGSVVTVPALGGTPRVIARVREPHAFTYLTWTADGKGLAFPDRDSENDPVSTFIVRTDTGERTRLFTAPDRTTHDFDGAFSPDGRFFAFVRGGDDFHGQLLLMPAGGGEPRKLVEEVSAGGGISWTPDSREIVYLHFETGRNVVSMSRVPISGGAPKLVTTSIFNLYEPSIARNGKGLVVIQYQNDANLWRLDLSKPAITKSIVADSQERDVDPACSHDGKQLVFLSYRNGADLWLADANGANPRRLTFMAETEAKSVGTPDWSPDQRAIAFSTRRNGQIDVSVVDVGTGDVRHLTSHPANDSFPRWSRNARSIYFSSDRSGRYEIWKMDADGSAQVQVTHDGGYVARESPDGKYLYYGKHDANGIWRMPTAGGPEEHAFDMPRRYAWAMSDAGIFYVNGSTFPGIAIHFYDFATGRTSHLYEPVESLDYMPAKISACRDGKTLYISQNDVTRSDLIWADNFK